MRTIKILVLVLAVCATTVLSENKADSPHGGRILELEEGKAEFVVDANHSVSVFLYDDNMKQRPPAKEKVTVIAEAPDGKTTLPLVVRENKLVSEGSLPSGHGYNVVVQIHAHDGAKPKNFRVPLDMSTCAECGKAEYACTCHE